VLSARQREANSNYIGTGNTYGQTGTGNRFANAYTWQSRLDLSIDTRTATDTAWFVLLDATFSWSNDSYTQRYQCLGFGLFADRCSVGQTNNGTSVQSPPVPSASTMRSSNSPASRWVRLSPFSAPWRTIGQQLRRLVGGGGSITGVNQFDYTAQFAMVCRLRLLWWIRPCTIKRRLELRCLRFRCIVYWRWRLRRNGCPDIVGNLSVSQLGLCPVVVAAHDNNVAYYTMAIFLLACQ